MDPTTGNSVVITTFNFLHIKAALKDIISLGDRRRGKTGKHGKVGVTRKWWISAHSPYSRQGNGKQLPKVEPEGIDHPTWKITQGAGIVKG